MPYYPSIDQDLQRADEILRKSNGEAGAIYGTDIFAAYKLLESFVEHIRYLHQQQDAAHANIEELETFKRRAIALNHKAQEQITEAEKTRDRYRAMLDEKEREHEDE
jgi:hypothetical protein